MRRLKAARIRHAQARLGGVILRDGPRCRWCGCEIARRKGFKPFPSETLVEANLAFAVLSDHRGRTRRVHWATADHLVEARRGGDASPENLVAACYPCNIARDWLDPGRDDPALFAFESEKCFCGGSKSVGVRHCPPCAAAVADFAARAHGRCVAIYPGPCRRCGREVEPLGRSAFRRDFYACPDCRCRRTPGGLLEYFPAAAPGVDYTAPETG